MLLSRQAALHPSLEQRGAVNVVHCQCTTRKASLNLIRRQELHLSKKVLACWCFAGMPPSHAHILSWHSACCNMRDLTSALLFAFQRIRLELNKN